MLRSTVRCSTRSCGMALRDLQETSVSFVCEQPPCWCSECAVSTQELPLCVACFETLVVGLTADGAGTSAMRRRQRRLRAMLRHERQTVAMELAAALHHSRDAGPGTYDGLRAQKTASSGKRPGVLSEPEAQVGAVMVGYVAALGLSSPHR